MSAKEALDKLMSQIDISYYLTQAEFKAIEKACTPVKKAVKKK